MRTHPHREAVLGILGSVLVAIAVAWAGSRGGTTLVGIPVFALCGVIAFAINGMVYVPSFLARTEKYYDLTGSLTYLTVVAFAFFAGGTRDARAMLLTAMIGVWAIRLGSFLFHRIHEAGTDARFDALKQDALRFLMAWTLQGLWVFLTLACALAAMTTLRSVPLGSLAWAGTALWTIGFAIEVVADRQKREFRRVPENRARFISTGLWAWSRHPNYFGEIMLWCGVALIAVPTLAGWQWVTLISPVFVYVLLTRVSGIPILEARADEKWGDDPVYLRYKAHTPNLFPRPPRANRESS